VKSTTDEMLDGAAVRSGGFHSGERCPLVPKGGEFEGQVAVLGETYIEGSVRGSLRGPGELVLAGSSRVEGLIECEVIASQGEIVGPILARSRAHLADGARIDGDVEAPIVLVDDEVVWNGRARIGLRRSS